MPILLSNKVISEVLGLRAVVKYFRKESSINIYEFSDKCKEWLEDNIQWDLMIIGCEVYLMEDIWGEGGAYTHKRFTKQCQWYLNLFDACEYILELKENK